MILKLLIGFFLFLILYSILSNLVYIEGLDTIEKEETVQENDLMEKNNKETKELEPQEEETKEEKEARIKKEKEIEKQKKIEEARQKAIQKKKKEIKDLNSKIESNGNNYTYLYNKYKTITSTDKDLSLLEKRNTNNTKNLLNITNKLQNKAIDALGGDPRETVKANPKATGLSISKKKYKEIEKEITP